MFFYRGLALLVGFVVLSNVGAQTTLDSYPGCYSSCGFVITDYKAGEFQMQALCDKSTSGGGLFFDNIEECANCVRTNNGLSSYFDLEDAEEIITVLQICPTAFPDSRDEMVSAILVISEYGHLAKTTTTEANTTTLSSTAVPATSVSATTTQPPSRTETPPVDESSHSEDKAWIAGPVVGSIVGVALVIVAAIFVLKRHKRNQGAGAAVDLNNQRGDAYEKAELPGEGKARHGLAIHNAMELDSNISAQELASREICELPGDERR
ncbi:uncharacterized protein N7479_003258 [Penicillium vulpinum]|uniref:Uncharacterized protein n=1 Tax=Penicillium vulpinum TaxID=29845 RepID=A0A1V6S3G9_9EURO|nr:uncharacterized protein N7479_003258 [Penicillium vulpinum]KAJ5963382.1 hypothetical protein N7479_003258 [Penicillium vulpinum]OQE08587.1 hypothetical protein PENVUL_c009G08587 [Penicillium vulpinum]